MAWYDDPIVVTVVALVIIAAVGTLIYVMRRSGKKVPGAPQQNKPQAKSPDFDIPYASTIAAPNLPFRVSKSVQGPMASNAKDELRLLDLEREILGDAIRRLYEAHAEGKISEAERDKLALSYKMRMDTIKTAITKDESIIALHELESMQEDLMKLFSERFGELTSKVEQLRGAIDVKPIREVPIKMPKQTPVQLEKDGGETEDIEEADDAEEESDDKPKQPKKPRKPAEEKPTPKTEAERRIESIRSEVEKVLDKLGQMEIEG